MFSMDLELSTGREAFGSEDRALAAEPGICYKLRVTVTNTLLSEFRRID